MAEGDGVGELPQNIIGDQRLPLRVVRDKRMDMSLQEIGGDCHRSLLAHLRVAVRSKDRSCRTPRSSCRAGCVDIEPRNAVMPARSTASVRSAMSPPNPRPTPSFSQGAVPRFSRRRVASCRRTTDFKTAQPLLVLLLPLPLDVELLLLAPELRCTLPFELVPGDRELVLDGDLVLHKHPHGGEGQISGFQFHVLEFRLLLVR